MHSQYPMEDAIQQAMAAVRRAKREPETAEAVDEVLGALHERAEGLGAGDALTGPLGEAEAMFRAGDIDATIQRLSRALIQITRLPPTTRR